MEDLHVEKQTLILVVFDLVNTKMTLMKREDALYLVTSEFSVMTSEVCGAIPSAWKKVQEDSYAPCVRTCFLEFQIFLLFLHFHDKIFKKYYSND